MSLFRKAFVYYLLLCCAVGQTVRTERPTQLRTMPSARSRVRKTLPQSTTLRLLAKTKRNGFYHVQVSQNVSGWVPSGSVQTVEAAGEATPMAGAVALAGGAGDRAHRLATKVSQVQTKHCSNITNFRSCHNTFAEGCTTSTQANTYDAFLSYLKNLTPSPASAESHVVHTLASLDDFTAFDQKSIQLDIGRHRQVDFAEELADIGQGNIYAAVGYLYYAVPGGIETCNCKLTNPDDRDFHIGIGFDQTTATEIENGTIAISDNPTGTDPFKQASVIVEMTPHYRAKYHPNWNLPLLQQLGGKQVKVVGQLLMDNEHNDSSQNCAFDDHDLNHCWRASVWELHPVTAFYVCSSQSPCAGDANEGWTALDDWNEQ
jgi:hypothetical protein